MYRFLRVCLLACFAFGCFNSAYALRFRVNNTGVDADFTDLASAVAGVSDGDILIVEHSNIPYNLVEVDINKKITIYGTGYYLLDNDETHADSRTSILGDINITSTDVLLSGLTMSACRVNADDVIVERCLIEGTLQVGDAAMVADVTVRQCFIEGDATTLIEIDCAILTFSNNFCYNQSAATGDKVVDMTVSSSGLILNNIFFGDDELEIHNVTLKNNIFELVTVDVINSSSVTASNNYAELSFLASFQPSDNIAKTDTMLDLGALSRDAKYFLLPTYVPEGGEGLEVGSFPYVLSGLPPIPSIWFYDGELTGDDGGIDVDLKVKGRR